MPYRSKSGGIHLFLHFLTPTPAELMIEREATFCGNMGEYTEVEYYVVNKILADIEKSRRKRKSK